MQTQVLRALQMTGISRTLRGAGRVVLLTRLCERMGTEECVWRWWSPELGCQSLGDTSQRRTLSVILRTSVHSLSRGSHFMSLCSRVTQEDTFHANASRSFCGGCSERGEATAWTADSRDELWSRGAGAGSGDGKAALR